MKVSTYGEPLTTREAEVFGHAAQGLTAPQIARLLKLATPTAVDHLKHIHTKMGITNRPQLIHAAYERAANDAPEHLRDALAGIMAKVRGDA